MTSELPTLDYLCKRIKEKDDAALETFLNRKEINSIIEGQVSYFFSQTSGYTRGELKAIIQNTVWHLIVNVFKDPPPEYDSGLTVLSFLTNFLGQYIKDYINGVDNTRPIPQAYAAEQDTIQPSMFEEHLMAELNEEKRDFLYTLFKAGQDKKLLDSADVVILLLRNQKQHSYSEIADQCSKMFKPNSPYTKGWAHSKYEKSLKVLKRLAKEKGIGREDI